jgi:hypothetical protein
MTTVAAGVFSIRHGPKGGATNKVRSCAFSAHLVIELPVLTVGYPRVAFGRRGRRWSHGHVGQGLHRRSLGAGRGERYFRLAAVGPPMHFHVSLDVPPSHTGTLVRGRAQRGRQVSVAQPAELQGQVVLQRRVSLSPPFPPLHTQRQRERETNHTHTQAPSSHAPRSCKATHRACCGCAATDLHQLHRL